jgi:ribosomal protein S18 acetylase RimI-like enzyme
MAPISFSITPLTYDLVDPLASLYASACFDNPGYTAIFLLEGDSKTKALHWFFVRRLTILHARGAHILVAIDDKSGKVIGGVGLVPPSSRPRLIDKLSIVSSWLCSWGFSSFLRLLELDRLASSGLVGAGELELIMMAVDEKFRRNGVGGEMVHKLLTFARNGDVIRLSTKKISNVRYYEHFGFHLLLRHDIKLSDPNCESFSQWVMEINVKNKNGLHD